MNVWVEIAQGALNFIVVSLVTQRAQEGTVADMKLDLRTTKEDLLSEIKETRVELLRMNNEQAEHTRDTQG